MMKSARPGRPLDQRIEKIRAALLAAFFELVQQQPYEDLTVDHIVERADVSRSTFYQHYRGKDALLAASIAGPFSVLANSLRAEDNTARLAGILAHFWDKRSLARAILAGSVRRKTAAVLVGQIEERLKADGLGRAGALILPSRLAAIQLAEILLAPVSAWLCGESRCTAEVLALALRRVGRAALAAMDARAAGKG